MATSIVKLFLSFKFPSLKVFNRKLIPHGDPVNGFQIVRVGTTIGPKIKTREVKKTVTVGSSVA